MGRKKGAETNETKEEAKPKVEEPKKEEEVEDPPIVKKLKEVDDKYLEIEREYEKAVRKLQIEFEAKQQPLLNERKEILLAKSEDANAPVTGTPALPGFWKTALHNSNACEDIIQEWDLPVLDFLVDVTKEHLKEDDSSAGFKLSFHFVENPYFSNEVLTKEFVTAEGSPYTGDMDIKEINCSDINWKPGKDVTVEKVVKKVKGGGAKKAKQKNKDKEEPRESFFRQFFQSLKEGMPIDALEGLDIPMDVDPDEIDEDEMLEYMMGSAHEAGCEIRDSVIPYAVRWYTGECKEDDDDDDDEDDEEEDDDDDDEDDDDSEDESEDDMPKGKGKGRGAKKGATKKSPKSSPKTGPAGDPQKTEECKQQ